MNDICISCGMPLDDQSRSKKDPQYCIYCQNQETGELATKEQVREGSVDAVMKFMGRTREEAEELCDDLLSTLPRWQQE